jgi:hypothetical protein
LKQESGKGRESDGNISILAELVLVILIGVKNMYSEPRRLENE